MTRELRSCCVDALRAVQVKHKRLKHVGARSFGHGSHRGERTFGRPSGDDHSPVAVSGEVNGRLEAETRGGASHQRRGLLSIHGDPFGEKSGG